MGLMGMMVPEQYGGAGMDAVSYAMCMEEISAACASTAVIMSVNNSLVCSPILDFGTDEQKKKFLTPLARGEKLGCFALSEPGHGSDPAGLKCTATKVDGGYKLNGTKNWITNGKEADYCVVFATIDKTLGHKGICAFIVDTKAKGFQVSKLEDKLGITGSSTAQLFFDDVFVPAGLPARAKKARASRSRFTRWTAAASASPRRLSASPAARSMPPRNSPPSANSSARRSPSFRPSSSSSPTWRRAFRPRAC